MIYLLFIFIIINYVRVKSTNISSLNIKKIPNKKIKVLTFNAQRLPYLLLRPNLDINKLLNHYDIVCLQENFCSLFGTNKKSYNLNCISPKGHIFKFTDSGLSIYSKYNIQYVDFVRFDDLKSVDKLSDKGFLVIKFDDMYIINTHLQANYASSETPLITLNQINKILDYSNKFNKVVICGDFNINIKELKIPLEYSKVVPYKPTHWCKTNTIFNISRAEESEGMEPFYFDGAIYKNLNISNTHVKKN
jgi:exonuclease III